MQNRPEMWRVLQGGRCGWHWRGKSLFWRVYVIQEVAAATVRQADLHRCNLFRGFLQECKKKRRQEGAALCPLLEDGLFDILPGLKSGDSYGAQARH